MLRGVRRVPVHPVQADAGVGGALLAARRHPRGLRAGAAARAPRRRRRAARRAPAAQLQHAHPGYARHGVSQGTVLQVHNYIPAQIMILTMTQSRRY